MIKSREIEEKNKMNMKRSIILGFLFTLLMYLITVFAGWLSGCLLATQSYYVFDTRPTIHLKSKIKTPKYNIAYFVVSNPTSQRKHYKFVCAPTDYVGNHQTKRIIIPPRSDKQIQIAFMRDQYKGSYGCTLEPDLKPGSTL